MDRRVLTPSLADLRTRTSVKWAWYPPDVLPLWVAEMDVEPAPAVVEAVRSAMVRGDTGYVWGRPYAEAFAAFADARWGWEPDVASTTVVPDVMTGVAEVLRVVTDPGDTVVVSSPVYPPFRSFVRHAGREVLDAPLGADGRLEPGALEDAFARARAGGRPAAYLLCNPHNPTGVVHTAAELTALGELAHRHGVRVVADEIHAPLVLPGAEFTPYLSLDVGEDAVALFSASKGWNLAGLKAAVAVPGPRARGDVRRIPEIVGHGAGHVGVQGHVAALTGGVDWLDDLVADLADNRDLLVELVAERLPGARMRPPEGTYLAWLDLRGAGLGDDPAAVALDHGRVALNPGRSFGVEGVGHARLNYATNPAVLTEAVERLASAAAAVTGSG